MSNEQHNHDRDPREECALSQLQDGRWPFNVGLPADYRPPVMSEAVYCHLLEMEPSWPHCRDWLMTVDPQHGRKAVEVLEDAVPEESREDIVDILFERLRVADVVSEVERGVPLEDILLRHIQRKIDLWSRHCRVHTVNRDDRNYRIVW